MQIQFGDIRLSLPSIQLFRSSLNSSVPYRLLDQDTKEVSILKNPDKKKTNKIKHFHLQVFEATANGLHVCNI